MSARPEPQHAALRAWLVHGEPPPAALARAFAEPELPPGLAESTLAAVLAPTPDALPEPGPAANRPAPRGGWPRWVAAAALAAAALLVWVGRPAPVGVPEQMTARGEAARLPQVALKMAARSGGQLDRLRADRTYRPGDALFFRVQSDGPGWFALVVSDGAGLRLLQQGPLSAGEADLRLGDALLTWTVEPGDGPAAFAVLSGAAPQDEGAWLGPLRAAAVAPAVAAPADPSALCEAARRAGLGCDAVQVEIAP